MATIGQASFFTFVLLGTGCSLGTDTSIVDELTDVQGTQDADGADGADTNVASDQPTCSAYCQEIMNECSGEHAVYSELRDCENHCEIYAGWEPGERDTPVGNTIGCRTYHAGLALQEGPALHCPHAGPTGGNLCGSWCENYCTLEARNCREVQEEGDTSIQLYPGFESCFTACLELPDAGFVAARDQDGDSIQCRINHLLLAGHDGINSARVHCPHGSFVATRPCVGEPTQGPIDHDHDHDHDDEPTACADIVPAGRYFLAATFSQSGSRPFYFAFVISDGNGGDPTATIQPLTTDTEDGGATRESPRTPVGEVTTAVRFTLDRGTGAFIAEFASMEIPGDANPVTPELSRVDVQIEGAFVLKDGACGSVDIQVREPVSLNEEGAPFAMVRHNGDFADIDRVVSSCSQLSLLDNCAP